MDSITHIALGACIGEAVLAKKAGKKGLLIGAIAQSFPDIDVVAALWLSPTENLLFHRGFTHSFFFGVLAAMPLGFIAKKTFRLQQLSWFGLFLFFCLQLWLHDVLDTCNAYGTGLFEPFSRQRFSFHLLFVADPFFSLSLVVAFIALVVLRNNAPKRKWWSSAGLLPALLYLFYAMHNKERIKERVEKSLAGQQATFKKTIITPTPFNIWLWYIVAPTANGYLTGYHSVFDSRNLKTTFSYHPQNPYLLQTVDTTINIKQLQRFANGHYTVAYKGDTLVFNVLRFGQVLGWQKSNAPFAFRYYLNPAYDNTLVVQRGRLEGWNQQTIAGMYYRIKGK